MALTSIEICAGAGGAALGIERAGFRHLALAENDKAYVETLRSVRRWGQETNSDVELVGWAPTRRELREPPPGQLGWRT